MEEQESKLYVGNLSFRVDEEQVNNFFEEKGVAVQAVTIIREKFTDRSKGFGFVTVSSEEEVSKAIELLNGQEFEGRNITVSKAQAREKRRNFSKPPRNSRGRRDDFKSRSRGPRNRY